MSAGGAKLEPGTVFLELRGMGRNGRGQGVAADRRVDRRPGRADPLAGRHVGVSRRLGAELPGYADYLAKVRYRLVPCVW